MWPETTSQILATIARFVRRIMRQILHNPSDLPLMQASHHGRTDSSSVGRATENKKTDFHFAVRGLRCESFGLTAQSRKRKESRSNE
jgi:hypothetical protein